VLTAIVAAQAEPYYSWITMRYDVTLLSSYPI